MQHARCFRQIDFSLISTILYLSVFTGPNAQENGTHASLLLKSILFILIIQMSSPQILQPGSDRHRHAHGVLDLRRVLRGSLLLHDATRARDQGQVLPRDTGHAEREVSILG